MVVSSKLATLHELKTIYSVEDLYDLIEINTINQYNEYLIQMGDEKKVNFEEELRKRNHMVE